jgi:hypothetical protein
MIVSRFYPVFNPPVPEAACASRGEALTKAINSLDDLAETNDLAPLSSYADNREVPLDFDENAEELDKYIEPWDEWFECGEGMEAFAGLARLLREDAAARSRLPDAIALAQELEEWVRALTIALAKGARFRLELEENQQTTEAPNSRLG